MANIKSQIKRNRQTEKRNLANRKTRSEIHTRTKSAEAALDAGSDDAAETVQAAIKRLDKSVGKGIMPRTRLLERRAN